MKTIYLNKERKSTNEDGVDLTKYDNHVSVGIEYVKNGLTYRMYFSEMNVIAFNDRISIDIEKEVKDDTGEWISQGKIPIPAKTTDFRYNNAIVNENFNPLFGQIEREPFINGQLKEGLVDEVSFFFMNILTNSNNLPIALGDFFIESMGSRI